MRRSGMLARQFSAGLTLLHVVDDDQPAAQVEHEKTVSEATMREQIRTLPELRDVDCQILVVAAAPFDGILQTAESTAADLIVMGSHRKQLLRDVFIGTTIERVIRTGPRPVLMVNQEPAHPYRRVLAAVDLSEASAHAIRIGNELGLLDGVDLAAVHAFVPLAKGTMYVGGAPRADLEKYVSDERSKLRTELRSFLAAAGTQRGVPSCRAEEGDPYEVIEAAARETEAELVVIGTHGRTGVAKALLGSVAEQVLYRLGIDILAVPPPRG
ncbi:MAG: universal stress protein [Bradyrhizobiaceae bacterium]|nr:universal stress protein [Bradyrhizobiaceae bacterium]